MLSGSSWGGQLQQREPLLLEILHGSLGPCSLGLSLSAHSWPVSLFPDRAKGANSAVPKGFGGTAYHNRIDHCQTLLNTLTSDLDQQYCPQISQCQIPRFQRWESLNQSVESLLGSFCLQTESEIPGQEKSEERAWGQKTSVPSQPSSASSWNT